MFRATSFYFVNMKRYLFSLVFLSFIISCKQECKHLVKIRSLKGQLDSLKSEQITIETKGQLVHLVFLDTRDDISEEDNSALIEAINNLREIPILKDLDIGLRADTDDPRFISNHELAFSLTVKNMEDYKVYQEHPIHLKLKEIAKDKLAGPPAVYDYWTN